MSKKQDQLNQKYNKYVESVSPKPTYFINCLKAFVVGGLVCTLSFYIQNIIEDTGINNKTAGTIVILILVFTAQILTGIGIFDRLVKYVGAGLIVPITGFANSIVSPAMEYKREGIVLGVGAKLFSLAGPVLVCGYSASVVVGLIYAFITLL